MGELTYNRIYGSQTGTSAGGMQDSPKPSIPDSPPDSRGENDAMSPPPMDSPAARPRPTPPSARRTPRMPPAASWQSPVSPAQGTPSPSPRDGRKHSQQGPAAQATPQGSLGPASPHPAGEQHHAAQWPPPSSQPQPAMRQAPWSQQQDQPLPSVPQGAGSAASGVWDYAASGGVLALLIKLSWGRNWLVGSDCIMHQRKRLTKHRAEIAVKAGMRCRCTIC